MVDIYPTSRVPVLWTIETSLDLGAATARVVINGLRYPLNWVGIQSQDVRKGLYTRVAEGILVGQGTAGFLNPTQNEVPINADVEPVIEVLVSGLLLPLKGNERIRVRELS